jgi:iron complex outermembrane receptor protein
MGKFPAAAFAWKIKEDLLPNSTTVSDLKFRVGYGITGQQEIGNNNDYLQQYWKWKFSVLLLVQLFCLLQLARQSSNLKWEETTTYNAGLDFDCTTIE